MYVTQIQANSPAMAAGIQSGDVIQSVDGEEIALWLSMKRYFRSVKREIRSGFRETSRCRRIRGDFVSAGT